MTLAGPQAYTVEEVIELCEKYAGADADVTKVPVWLLRVTRNLLRGFQWARDAADRLVSMKSPQPVFAEMKRGSSYTTCATQA